MGAEGKSGVEHALGALMQVSWRGEVCGSRLEVLGGKPCHLGPCLSKLRHRVEALEGGGHSLGWAGAVHPALCLPIPQLSFSRRMAPHPRSASHFTRWPFSLWCCCCISLVDRQVTDMTTVLGSCGLFGWWHKDDVLSRSSSGEGAGCGDPGLVNGFCHLSAA